jgi:zinc/manganese transport system permease protein
MLVGNILTVSWTEVGHTALLYGAIGAFHIIFRRKCLMISMNHGNADLHGMSVRFWDFLFYASFGIVVTSSVAIAGVLLVFCYLIVPSVGAMLFANRIGPRLAIGWTMGTLVSALGVYLSVLIDLPTGATIVCTFGLVLVIMFLVYTLVPTLRGSREIHGTQTVPQEEF